MHPTRNATPKPAPAPAPAGPPKPAEAPAEKPAPKIDPGDDDMPDCPPPKEGDKPASPGVVNALVNRISRELCATLIVNHADSLAAAFGLERSAIGDLLRHAADEFTSY